MMTLHTLRKRIRWRWPVWRDAQCYECGARAIRVGLPVYLLPNWKFSEEASNEIVNAVRLYAQITSSMYAQDTAPINEDIRASLRAQDAAMTDYLIRRYSHGDRIERPRMAPTGVYTSEALINIPRIEQVEKDYNK